MNATQDRLALPRTSWRTCKPAVVCDRGSSRGLPASGRGNGRGNGPGAFAIDETEEILFALASAVEQRDHHTAGHCERLAFLGVALGAAMGLPRPQLVTLFRGGYLHDVGKVGIPDSILFKTGPLTADEWATMRSHTTRGEEICRHMKSLAPVLPIIRHHHERWDGSGYPDGLRGEQIPRLARILQVVDIYDALANPRSYKAACAPDRAIAIIQEETDRGWRDPQIVQVFLKLHKGVLLKAQDLIPRDRSIEGMRSSLVNLEHVLAAETWPAILA